MRRLLTCCGLMLALAAPAAAQGPAPTPSPTPTATPAPAEQRIAPGVRAGHVDVGGLLVDEAAARLQSSLPGPLRTPFVISVADRHYRFEPARAGIALDALKTAKRAYYAGRDRPEPPAGALAPVIDVPLAVSYRAAALRALVERIAREVAVAPRNARIRITPRRIVVRRAREGRALQAARLTQSLAAGLADPALPRVLRPGRSRVHVRTNYNDLRRAYNTIVTIDRSTFKLRLFKGFRLRRTYGVAVGRAGLDTPAGRYAIHEKETNPAWHVPRAAWAGSLAGRTIPGGAPNNPLKARWLGIANGVGIHGTAEDWSIGSRASHGCIRMHVRDVVDLYRRVPVGAAVLIH